jgi:microcystin-dependent protein
MSDPFIGEVKIFAGTFAPRGWAFCDGQVLPIAQNTALFSLLGTTYGGDGRTTFALPNLGNRMPMHAGHGPGLTPRSLGEASGDAAVTLTTAQIPAHGHELRGTTAAATDKAPSAAVALAVTPSNVYRSATNLVASSAPLAASGGGQPHENRQPYLKVGFIIALQGIYPARS